MTVLYIIIMFCFYNVLQCVNLDGWRTFYKSMKTWDASTYFYELLDGLKGIYSTEIVHRGRVACYTQWNLYQCMLYIVKTISFVCYNIGYYTVVFDELEHLQDIYIYHYWIMLLCLGLHISVTSGLYCCVWYQLYIYHYWTFIYNLLNFGEHYTITQDYNSYSLDYTFIVDYI